MSNAEIIKKEIWRAIYLFEGDAEEVKEAITSIERIISSLTSMVNLLEDLAEGDCYYGDDCPAFGSRHGRCVACRARLALEKLK